MALPEKGLSFLEGDGCAIHLKGINREYDLQTE